MTKKKEEIQTVEAKAFVNPDVTSRININTNQDDLIGLVVEERSEQLEKLIELQEKKIEDIESTIASVIQKTCESYINDIKKSAEYKTVEDTIKKLNLTVDKYERTEEYFKTNTYGIDAEDITFEHSSLNTAEETKNPVAAFKRNTRTYYIRSNFDKRAFVKIEAANDSIALHYEKEYIISEKDYQKMEEKVKSIFTLLAKEKTALHNLKLEYLSIKYGANKIKNQILKASLKKSEDGRAILDMLSKATNIKLLG
jgi:hypothetical protein